MFDSAFPWHFGANKKLVQLSTFSPQPLYLLFPFVQIAECICSNCNMYLFKLLDIFVQIAKSVFVHLLSSTSPFPSPFPFPILELKISRFRIFKRTLWIEFVPAIYLANKKKGEEEVGEMFQSSIHIPDLWQNYFVQKVFVFELLCVGKFLLRKYSCQQDLSPPSLILFSLSASATKQCQWSVWKQEEGNLSFEAEFESIPSKLNSGSLAWSDIVKKLQTAKSCRYKHISKCKSLEEEKTLWKNL